MKILLSTVVQLLTFFIFFKKTQIGQKMITVSQAAQPLSISPERLKQILKEHSELEVERAQKKMK